MMNNINVTCKRFGAFIKHEEHIMSFMEATLTQVKINDDSVSGVSDLSNIPGLTFSVT